MKLVSAFAFQKTAMRKNLLLAALLFGLQGFVWAQPQSSRKALAQPTEIQGYPCAKGYAWFFADGKLERCAVTRAVAFGEATVPSGSWITLLPDGKPRLAQLKQDAKVAGVTCMGGSWLGPGEGATTAFYPSGKLKQCYLAGDQTVQGVPCTNGGLFGDGMGGGAEFYENGKLKSCKLTRDFGALHKGERFTQAP
jgi:hypothetical protein